MANLAIAKPRPRWPYGMAVKHCIDQREMVVVSFRREGEYAMVRCRWRDATGQHEKDYHENNLVRVVTPV